MPKIELPKEDVNVKSYNPVSKDKETLDFVIKRVERLKDYRQQKLIGNSRSIEDIWKDADREYQPHELSLSGSKTLVSDDTNTTARYVDLNKGGAWQSNQSSPDFYVKVNTALSILVDQNPEAVFIPSSKKYENSTLVAYGNWKNSWEVSGAKQQLKNFIFNMAKYGTGVMRTYPKIVEIDKKIRTEYYKDQPGKDVYESRHIVKYNDLCRESINPKRVWTSESARPGNYDSIDDWYFEVDYSDDKFHALFKDYKNSEFVGKKAKQDNKLDEESNNNENKVTVGFYENQVLDLYIVFVPSKNIMLYYSPLPNDDGMLSLTIAPWSLRHDESIYGIGLFEIIKNDCVLYDRVMNMSMDQLVLSLYKMFFYKGTDILGENGQLTIEAGKGVQVMDPNNIKFLEVPGPGNEAWQGLRFLQDRKDTLSGVTPQLSAQYAGKTLGQDLQAKEAALERMKTPLDYILDALQQEAYITLSWQKQILSTPEVLEYTDPETLQASLKEFGLSDEEIQSYTQEMNNPQDNGLFFSGQPNENGEQKQYANVYKETSLNVNQDENRELIEDEESRFYRFGLNLPIKLLDWKGIIRIKPQSVLAPSKELTKRMKLDLFNLVQPSIAGMLAQPMNIPILLNPIKQIIKVYEEDVKDWIDEKALMRVYQQATQPQPKQQEDPKLSFSIKFETLVPEVQEQVLEKFAGIKVEEPLFINKNTGQGMPSGAPQSPIIMNAMPQGDVEQPEMAQTMDMGQGGEMGIKPIAGLDNGGQSSNEDLIANMPMQ